MRKLILLFTLILNSFVFGQVKDTIIDGKKTVIYSSIENEAVFSKGNGSRPKVGEKCKKNIILFYV